jgi:hypothetical protein
MIGGARKNKITRIAGQFAPRTIDMLESPAFRVLSLSGRRVLDRLEIEIAHHGGKDNGSLPVTFDDFQRYGIHRQAISAAIRECVALGFVEVTERGKAGNREFRSPNLFRLTYRPTEYAASTDEWRSVVDEHQAIELAGKARKATASKPTNEREPMAMAS